MLDDRCKTQSATEFLYSWGDKTLIYVLVVQGPVSDLWVIMIE